MDTPVRQDQWRKSSYSSNGANCVEVSGDLDALRDSKNPHGPVLAIAVRDLVATVKSQH